MVRQLTRARAAPAPPCPPPLQLLSFGLVKLERALWGKGGPGGLRHSYQE